MDQPPKQPVIFVAFANDRDDTVRYLRNLPEEARRLQQALEGEAQQRCELVMRQNAMLKDILDVFQRAKYRQRIAVFHYGGHANGFQLLLETAEGQPAGADAAGLAHFLAQQTGLQLVFLNGCSTELQVAGLQAAHIPAVIATAQAIKDEVAMEFAARFYRGLASGATLQQAYYEAEGAVQCEVGQGRSRDAYLEAGEAPPAGRWPWALHLQPDGRAADWSLSEVAEAPQPEPPPTPRQPFEPETILIPAGPFKMGSSRSEDVEHGDWLLTEVDLDEYAIGQYPVTNEQYARFVDDKHHDRRPQGFGWSFIRPPRNKLNHPVVGITFFDAWAYCMWLFEKTGRHYRLPTEAEWEKAARGDRDERRYPWGDTLTAEHCDFVGSQTDPVDAYPEGQSPYGCFDMLGNIYEWTCTRWDEDGRKAQARAGCRVEPPEEAEMSAGVLRVCKGGPTQSGAFRLGCSVRSRFAPNSRHPNIGFRVVEDFARRRRP